MKVIHYLNVFERCLDKKKRIIKDGITINVVIIKKMPQSPSSQSTSEPEDDAKIVLPAVPIDARSAY